MKKILLFLIIILICAGVYAGYKKFSPEPEIKIIQTAKVKKGNIRAILVETGIIKPQVGAQVKIGARATGEIIAMNVEIGSKVKKGELIALIDDREILNTIEQINAAILSKRHTLSQVERTYPERIKEARANYKYAEINYKRESELIKNDFTTMDAVDQTKSRLAVASAILNRLEDEHETQLDIVKADLKELAARLRQQKIRLSYTKIVAPINGIVSDITAQKGETIVTGLQVANLVTILNPGLLEMWIYVDETDIGRVKIGQKVEYYVDTYTDKTFKGRIEKIYPQPVTKDNITYYLAIVKITIDDAMFFKPEMTTYSKIIIKEKKNILSIPNAAIKFEKGRQIGYRVLPGNKTEKVYLKTGIRGEEKSEILSGVAKGDILATKLILPISGKSAQH